ncbi:putative Tubulin/FtsZ family, GTPase domain containing protein [Trypanosoma cruzi]|nr:putative Tubulin/FtsZ family, GTPase domain containing protein [Trypanosoma cruzi]
MERPLVQPDTSTLCQGLVLFAREEAKRLLPIRCTRRGRRRRTNGSEGQQMEPCTWLPAERYFHPLLNSIGAYQRYTYCLRAVCDAERQKLLLSGDIEQNPGPIAVLQMNVSCLTPSKLATLMAQGADIDSHPGDLEVVGADRQHAYWRLCALCTVAHRQGRRCGGAGAENSPLQAYTSHHPPA